MNEIKEFLKAIVTDPRAKELLKGMKEPATTEEAVEQYVMIAKKLGLSISREAILEYVSIREKVQQKQTAKAESEVKTALDEDALDSVAGGGDGDNSGCDSTTKDADEEWCWFSDACNHVVTFYETVPNEPNYQYSTWDMCDDNAGDFWVEVIKCSSLFDEP